MSTTSPSAVSKLVRPSWGRRRSAMSMPAMIFMRLSTPAWRSLEYSRRSCRTPSTRQRICSMSSRGSTWMSEAFMPMASVSTESTISMIEASRAPGGSGRLSPSALSSSLSLPRLLVKMERASSKALSAQMAGTTLRLVRSRTSSMTTTSSGLVMAMTRPPLSSRRSGSRRWRTMKSRGSRPTAAGLGVTARRSTTDRCIWPARAWMRSSSETRPAATRTSPRRPPACCWRASASSIWAWLTMPLSTSMAPSLRRPALRRWRRSMATCSLSRRSSTRNGLVTYSAMPRRCACSKVSKSLVAESTITGAARRAGVEFMSLSTSKPSMPCRSMSSSRASGGASRSARSAA